MWTKVIMNAEFLTLLVTLNPHRVNGLKNMLNPHTWKGKRWVRERLRLTQIKLEQLERLRSEDTPAASWLPIPLSHIGSQVKRRQSQSYKFKKIAKISNFWILKRALHATHLLKLLDKMCKYEIDPMSIVEDTERTRFCPQTDRRTRWYQYTPLSTSLKRGYN